MTPCDRLDKDEKRLGQRLQGTCLLDRRWESIPSPVVPCSWNPSQNQTGSHVSIPSLLSALSTCQSERVRLSIHIKSR